MLAAVVLATRLLGLVSGPQPLRVQVDPEVRVVDVVVDGHTIATLRAPFTTVLNFGTGIAPHELMTIGYDGEGHEVGRDTQLVNLARPQAEAEIVLERERNGALRAIIKWQHIGAEKPRRFQLTLDGKVIAKKETATLPELEPRSIHVLQAEVAFQNGVVATKELVFGGQYSEQVPAELTGIVAPAGAECFRSGDTVVHAAAIDKPDALVLFVRSGDADLARKRLRLPGAGSRETGEWLQHPFLLHGVKMRYIWPVAKEIRPGKAQSVVNLFWRSEPIDGTVGTLRMLTLRAGPDAETERFADAVAVAAVQSLSGTQRRAVVLVLGGERDYSRHPPFIVRHYLERIGVPLRVWSLTGVKPEMTAAWGDVRDVSNPDLLRIATEELRQMLDQQRIAWLALHPLAALKAEVVPCPAH
jgi:hypothetical protein